MSAWPSSKATTVLRALKRIGRQESKRQTSGSHRKLVRDGKHYTWAFHDGDEIGPGLLAFIGKQTGLKPSDL